MFVSRKQTGVDELSIDEKGGPYLRQVMDSNRLSYGPMTQRIERLLAGPPFVPPRQIGVGDIRIGEKERRYLQQVIDSNRLSYGPMTQRLERLFAEEHQCKYSVFCNSGTSALHIALAALKEKHGWKDGDEVIVPAVTFAATVNIVIHNNMTPVFVDVDQYTYNIDPELIEDRITRNTRAIIPVHLFGMPCDMDAIIAIAQKHDLKIIEDSCETMFATYKGRKVGSLGDIGCFSTYVAHLMVTGVGGFATTNDPDLAVMLKSLMNHGRDSIYLSMDDDQDKTTEELYNMVERRFRFIHSGHSFRCTELEAALGLGQLERRDEMIRRRRENAGFYMHHLKPYEAKLQLPYIPGDREHVFMMFPIVMRNGGKEAIVRFLEDHLIETRDMLPVLNQPVYRKRFGDIESAYPVAQWINRSGFYIGCHPYLSDDELRYVVETFGEFFAWN